MSRAKIGHEFCPMPRKWHAGWAHHDGAHARGVRNALFELADGASIPVHGADWLESLCKQMQFHGRERPNVRKTLKAFAADGLIAWDGAGLVLVCFLPGAELVRSVVDRSPFVVDSSSTGSRLVTDRLANEHPLNIPLESTPRNDSGHDRQTDRRDRKKEETEENAGASASMHAREDLLGFKFVASLLGRNTFGIPPLGAFTRDYTWLGARPESERAAVKLAVEADPWCQANKHLVDAPHLCKRWQRYLGGAPKPVVRVDNREADAAAQLKAKREYFNAQIRKARAAGDEYNENLLLAERDTVLARMQARLAS